MSNYYQREGTSLNGKWYHVLVVVISRYCLYSYFFQTSAATLHLVSKSSLHATDGAVVGLIS